MEASSAGGASGYSPRMAWLPMTTISPSFAIAPAARMMCSSSERVMHAATLVVGQEDRERRGLAQPRGVLAQLGRPCGDLAPGPLEERVPLAKRRGRPLAMAREPALHGCPRPVEQPRIGSDAPSGKHMQRQ